jgi:hypothetical protein
LFCFGQACTGPNADPYASGSLVECCGDTKKCLIPNDWFYLCKDCSLGHDGGTFTCDESNWNDEACVASEHHWPDRDAGDGTPAPFKRGLAKKGLSALELEALAGVVSWGYSWEMNPASIADWTRVGIEHLPMIWGSSQAQTVEADDMALARFSADSSDGVDFCQSSRALLGFNEPNFDDQADLLPSEAAHLWPVLEQTSTNHNIPILVGPAMNFNTYDPVDWLDHFFANCTALYGADGCRVDAIAVHSYTCYVQYLRQHLDVYRKYGKPLWLTEFACADSIERIDQAGQLEYMAEAIPALEADKDVCVLLFVFSFFLTRLSPDNVLCSAA